MICKKCGGNNKDSVKFCAFCGEAMEATPAASGQPANLSAAPAGATGGNPKNTKIIGMVACAVVVIVVVGLLFTLFGGAGLAAGTYYGEGTEALRGTFLDSYYEVKGNSATLHPAGPKYRIKIDGDKITFSADGQSIAGRVGKDRKSFTLSGLTYKKQ